MKLSPGFDPERKAIVFILQVGFLDKYYSNLEGLMKGPNLPKNIKLKRLKSNEVEISFPMFDGTEVSTSGNEGRISIPIEHQKSFESFHDALKVFINAGIRKELQSYEFIPLKNYPIDDLLKDVQSALDNKRGYCIMDDYTNYLKDQEERTFEYYQHRVDYGSEGWADFIIETLGAGAETKKEKEKIHKFLQTKYTPMLRKVSWV